MITNKKIILLSALIVTHVSLFAQKDLTVVLRNAAGFSPFEKSQVMIFPMDNPPIPKDVPSDIQVYSIRKVDFQPYNADYRDVVKNGWDREEFLKGIEHPHLLTAQEYHNVVYVLMGVNRRQEHVIIFDSNHNLSFRDDTPFRYPKLNGQSAEQEEVKKLSFINLPVQYFDGTKVSTKLLKIRVNPYKQFLNINYKDTMENKFFLGISISAHKSGTFSVGGQQYKMSLSNGFRSIEYRKDFTSLIVSGSKESRESLLPYNIGDDVFFGKYQYKFEKVSVMGDTVTFRYIGINNRRTGFVEGTYVPKLNARQLDGSAFDLSAFKGKYVLLDFWGTWCAPCIQAIPEIKRLNEQFKGKQFALISVANDDETEKVKQFVLAQKMNWMHVYQNDNSITEKDILKKLKISGYPCLILIDPEGKIISRNKSIEEVEKTLLQLL